MNIALKRLGAQESGFVLSTELFLVATIALLGFVVAFAAVRDGVVSELSDSVGSVQDLNQSFTVNGVTSPGAYTAGSSFNDALDMGDSVDDVSGEADNCIVFDIEVSAEGKYEVSRSGGP